MKGNYSKILVLLLALTLVLLGTCFVTACDLGGGASGGGFGGTESSSSGTGGGEGEIILPDKGDENPDGGDENPDGGDEKPDGGDENPDKGDENPDGGDEKPDKGDENPDKGDENPDGGDENPDGGDENPDKGDENPDKGDENPDKGDENPDKGDENPDEGDENPDGGDENPDGGDEKPDGGDENPDKGDENPDGGDEKPDKGDENPDKGDENPDGGDENPDKGDENPDGGEQKENEYEHIIVFYSAQGDKLYSITKKAIEKFEQKYPGWKVLHIAQGGYDDVKEATCDRLANGKQPDIVYCYPDHIAEYLYSGKVVDLNKYISSTEKVNGNTVGFTTSELNDFVASYYNQGKASNFAWKKYQNLYSDMSDESMLMLPFLRSTDVMYYNKTALDACGLTPAKTWDELWNQCATILKNYPYCTPVGIDSEANLFMNVCKQNGWGYTSVDENSHYLFNGTEQAAWLNQLRSYYMKGYFTTEEDVMMYMSNLFTKGVMDGGNGCVYCIASSGGSTHHYPNAGFTWGVSAIPGIKKADGSIDTSAYPLGPSLLMLSGGNKVTNVSEKEKMTFLFMKELLDPEFQSEMSAASGYNPVRQSAYDCDYLKELFSHVSEQTEDGIVARTMAVCKEEAENQYVNPAFEGSLNLTELIGNAVLYAMWGNKTGEVALKDAYDEALKYVRKDYTDENPDGGDENPDGGDENPDKSDENPDGGDENPDKGDENPDKGDENPDGGDENPDKGDENPDGGDENPDKGDENPDKGETDKPRKTTIRNILENPEQFYDDYDGEGAKVEFYAYLESLTVTSTYKFVAVDIVEDGKTYKIDVYAGYASSSASKMKIGHVYRIVGTVQKYQGNLQISGISYSEETKSDDDTYVYIKDVYLTFSSDEKYTDNYSDTLYSDVTVVSSSVVDGVLTIVAQAYKKIGDNKYASTATNFVFCVEVGSDYENVFTAGKTFSVCGYQSNSNVIYILDYSSIVLKS